MLLTFVSMALTVTFALRREKLTARASLPLGGFVRAVTGVNAALIRIGGVRTSREETNVR